ncbi:MAG: oxygen-independent coproporphyrinogen III oxidase, partial [Thiobacillus sp.]
GFAVERGIRLTRDDQVRRDAITRVMCDLELDFSAFGKEWDVSFGDYFADALVQLHPLAEDGLVDITADRISVTPTGRLFLRNIGMCFDRYLEEAAGERPRYSRTA